MSEKVVNGEITRRNLLAGAATAIAGMMLQPMWLSRALAQESVVKKDPRFSFIDRISEITIPTTDTPGASAAGVPVFVLLALDQRMNGLDPILLTSLQTELDRDAAGIFLSRSADVQISLLEKLDERAFRSTPQAATPEHAWQRIKAAIVAGYYTSEIGASKELKFDPVPGPPLTNITLTPDYRARSNDGAPKVF